VDSGRSVVRTHAFSWDYKLIKKLLSRPRHVLAGSSATLGSPAYINALLYPPQLVVMSPAVHHCWAGLLISINRLTTSPFAAITG